MGVIEELDKIYSIDEWKEQQYKNIINRIDDQQLELEKLKTEIIDLKKRIDNLECDTGIIGGVTLD